MERPTAQPESSGERPWLSAVSTALVWAGVAALLAFFVYSLQQTGFSIGRLTLQETGQSSVEAFRKILVSLVSPSTEVLPEVTSRMLESIEMGLVGTVLSVAFSFVACFGAARNLTAGSLPGRLLYWTLRVVFNVVRAFPPIVLALLFVVLWGTGPFAGVMALAVHSVGMLGKLFAESIETVDEGPVEAIQASGASHVQVLLYGILPQVLPQFLAYSLYRWDINIRMSIILGIVGAGGIGFLLEQYFGLLRYEAISTVFLAILIVVTVLDWSSTMLREKLGVGTPE